jgi:hypothetical protein
MTDNVYELKTLPKVDLLVIHGTDKPIASIGPDGTVTIHQLGAEPKAAKAFWDAIHVHGVSLFNRITTLEAENSALKDRLNKPCPGCGQ